MEDIRFFSRKYSFLSNFHLCPVEYEGLTYPSSEHAYQAAKTLDPSMRRFIGSATNPAKAREYGRKIDLRPEWELAKLSVMEEILRSKFKNPDLHKKLLETGDAYLEEGNWWGDKIWGRCNGEGQNLLGKLLMKLRKELQNESQTL